ncbi:MAG: hypothetical protein ABIN89_12285, partial [Chitinophagaceae bacterium]
KHIQFSDNLPLHFLTTNKCVELFESTKNARVKIGSAQTRNKTQTMELIEKSTLLIVVKKATSIEN